MFAIAVSGVFVLLSQWQFGRSTQAEVPVSPATEDVKALTGTLQPGDFFHGSVADQMVTATGTYDPAKQVLVPGRLKDGEYRLLGGDGLCRRGAPVLSGAAASPETWIPVARGWVADPAEAADPPSGTVGLTGRLLPSEAPRAQHGSRPGPRHAPSPSPNSSTSGTSAATRGSSRPRPKCPAGPTSAPRPPAVPSGR